MLRSSLTLVVVVVVVLATAPLVARAHAVLGAAFSRMEASTAAHVRTLVDGSSIVTFARAPVLSWRWPVRRRLLLLRFIGRRRSGLKWKDTPQPQSTESTPAGGAADGGIGVQLLFGVVSQRPTAGLFRRTGVRW